MNYEPFGMERLARNDGRGRYSALFTSFGWLNLVFGTDMGKDLWHLHGVDNILEGERFSFIVSTPSSLFGHFVSGHQERADLVCHIHYLVIPVTIGYGEMIRRKRWTY